MPTTIDWRYPLMMGAALVAGGVLLRNSQKSLPLTAGQKLGLGIGAFCGAMIGAKLPFVVAEWLADAEQMLRFEPWLSHGKTIMCGIVGGYFGVEAAKWALDIRVKTGDTFAFPVAVAVAIGRVACYFGGCCYGRPTSLPWGIVFPLAVDDPHAPRHPTQLYEAAFHLAAAFALYWLGRRGLLRGQLIKLYLICYLVYRFVTEFIRPEAPLGLGLTGYQWSALTLLPLFAWLWIRDAAKT
jgi:phosphatidylglycerol:prolipoprotein diacylglycerol transferase